MKLSILIPVYNTSAYLPKCLDSVINQSYSNIEIIAVNDGSTDDSQEVLSHYAKKHSNIHIITQTNQGHQAARKVAIEVATGEFIAFLDSDDSLPTCDVVTTMINAFDHEIDMVVGKINIDNGDSVKPFPSATFDTIDAQTYLCKYLLCAKVSWNMVAKIYRANLIKENISPPIKVTAGEDALYVNLLASRLSGNIKMVDLPVYNYYVRAGSITQSSNPQYIVDNFNVADCIQDMLAGKVEFKYLIAFRLLCMSASFRYGWLGRKHPLYENAINLYKQTPGVVSLLTVSKRLKIWMIIHFGDIMSKYNFKNRIENA